MLDVAEQLADMQSQLAFQEEALRKLDEVMTRQQQDILILNRTVELLRQQLKQTLAELEGFRENSAPPHY